MNEKTVKPYAPKTKANDWCGRCGGGGAWMERTGGDLKRVDCPVCEGAGVVPANSKFAWGRRADLPAV